MRGGRRDSSDLAVELAEPTASFIAVLGSSRRRRIGRRLLLVGRHLAPLVLHVQQQRNERVFQFLFVFQLVAKGQFGYQRL